MALIKIGGNIKSIDIEETQIKIETKSNGCGINVSSYLLIKGFFDTGLNGMQGDLDIEMPELNFKGKGFIEDAYPNNNRIYIKMRIYSK